MVDDGDTFEPDVSDTPAAFETTQESVEREKFNERHVNLGRYYLTQQRARLNSSSNNMLVALSFCFLFEATIFARYSPSDFSVEVLALHAVPIAVLIAANAMLVISLIFSIICSERMKVMIPYFEGGYPIPMKYSKVDYKAEWLIEEFAHMQYSFKCSTCARLMLDFSQFLALLGICNAAFGIMWAIFYPSFREQLFPQVNIVVLTIITLLVIMTIDMHFIVPKAKRCMVDYRDNWPGDSTQQSLDKLRGLKREYREKIEGDWWCDKKTKSPESDSGKTKTG